MVSVTEHYKPSNIVQRMCLRKKAYPTELDAKRDLRAFLRREKNLDYYACDWCDCWHIGHKISKTNMKKLRAIVRDYKKLVDISSKS